MKILKKSWIPSGKWDCGELEFTVETPIGTVEVKEIHPGPQYGPDAGGLSVKVNGVEKDLDFPGCEFCFDFGQPTVWSGEERQATAFRDNLDQTILEEVERFVKAFQGGELEYQGG